MLTLTGGLLLLFSRFAKWKRTAEEWFRRDSEMFEGLVDSVRTKMVSRVEQRVRACVF